MEFHSRDRFVTISRRGDTKVRGKMQAYKSKRARTLHGTKSTALVGHVASFQARRIILDSFSIHIYIILSHYIYTHPSQSQGKVTLPYLTIVFCFAFFHPLFSCSLSLLFPFVRTFCVFVFVFFFFSMLFFFLSLSRFSGVDSRASCTRSNYVYSRRVRACLYVIHPVRCLNLSVFRSGVNPPEFFFFFFFLSTCSIPRAARRGFSVLVFYVIANFAKSTIRQFT